MSAREEIRLTQTSIQKLGIIAGGGTLPSTLWDACEAQGIDCTVVGFDGYTDKVSPHFWGRIGGAGKIIKFLRAENVSDIVFIGAIKRPTIWDLWPDWLTFKFFLKSWRRVKGDNGLLSAVRQELESMGFRLHGIQQFMPQLLMPMGLIGKIEPKRNHYMDIQVGITASQDLGRADIGQAVIVKDGAVIGCEDGKGTSALIRKYGTKGAILVKSCKPQQDRDLDLPTIGPDTVRLCVEKGMSGIAGHAGHMLIVDEDMVKKLANENRIFVIGVTFDAA